MAAIDSEYWTKCIGHMFKEVHHYMLQDRVKAEVPTTMEPAIIVETPANPMIICVSWNLKKNIVKLSVSWSTTKKQTKFGVPLDISRPIILE